MSVVSPSASAADLSRSPAAAAAPPRGWLFGPWVDLLLVANVAWPLVAWFAGAFAETDAYRAFGFLLAFFVIMPHRWVTLPLVFLDRQRLAQRPLAFLGVLAFVVVLCWSIRLSMPTLALLVAIDYLWNAWHFSAQHAGIARIYGRLARPQDTGGAWEKVLLRTFFLYVLLRLTGQFVPAKSFPWLEWVRAAMPQLAPLDFVVLLLPVGLLLHEIWGLIAATPSSPRSALGRLIYLVSVCSLYATLLMALHFGHAALIFGCTIAATLMHSSEYLAVVSWAVPKNRSLSQSAVFARILPRWTLALLAFMAFFAVTSCVLQQSFVDPRWLAGWVWLNFNVSLLHYAYDGMIWKRPKAKPAAMAT
jgi:hypothetical protein